MHVTSICIPLPAGAPPLLPVAGPFLVALTPPVAGLLRPTGADGLLAGYIDVVKGLYTVYQLLWQQSLLGTQSYLHCVRVFSLVFSLV